MKYLLLILSLTGCGIFTTGEGEFKGQLVDVSWEGLLFKSCEVGFQFGENSSKASSASSRSKDLCDDLKSKIGNSVKIKYKTWAKPCCVTMSTNYELYEGKDEQ